MKHKIMRGGVMLAMVVLLPIMHEARGQESISSSLGVIVYPAKDQTAQQQNKDEGECYSWAKQQTGIDPIAVANTPTQQSGAAVGGGERVSGAARGALGGLAIGAITGDEGEGAAVGAIAGGMLGGRKARQNKSSREQQAQQSKNSSMQQFNKGFGVCMEAKDYVVK